MQLNSLDGCKLRIGSFPPFAYNAYGGGGEGTVLPCNKKNILYIIVINDF